jgi:outer membrane protein assembly factor BamD (BamD/ComL family)
MTMKWHGLAIGVVFALGTSLVAQSSDEDVARRQLESGRAFMRQGNYTEALKDFRAVADTHASSSVADAALLEIARYYFEIAEDYPAASTAVADILKKYATSHSAPDAYVLAGRLALASSHQPADLEAAVANFDRVIRLFPASSAVPNALELLGETNWYAGKLDDAQSYLGRVEAEYSTTTAAADAYLAESRVLVARGDPIAAMEELQQVRNRWPSSAAATTALARTTVLYRLYIRAHAGGAAYALAPDTVGPAKIENAVDLAITPKGALYLATETGVTPLLPPDAPKPPAASRPRALAVDTSGNLAVLEPGMLHPGGSDPFSFPVLRSNGVTEALSKATCAGQLSSGDWIVADENEKFLHRYSRVGKYGNVFSTARLSKFAISSMDEVAGLDRDQKAVTILDATGKPVGHIPYKGTGYEVQNPEALAYDAFGHLYVLDHTALVVFSPFPPPADPSAPKPATPTPPTTPTTTTDRGATYHLLTVYSEPEKSPGAFRKATAFAIDRTGTVYLYDDHAQRILVYR